MDEYLAMIKFFAGNFAPRGFMFCQGQLLPISQYSALFALLGTTYGGDGRQTFALPNFGGRVPVGTGQSGGTGNYALGQVGGTENVTLNINNMPAHTHTATATSTLYAESDAGSRQTPAGNMFGSLANLYTRPTPSDNQALSDQAVTTSVTVGQTGGSQPFDNHQPYLAINYVICISGPFPSRN